jgi:acylphosphatase
VLNAQSSVLYALALLTTHDSKLMTQNSPLTKRFIVRGRVQGVGFRWFVEREAKQLGLAGWVRNNEDSTVECLASGPDDRLETLRARLKQGPRASRVDRVEVLDASESEVPETFEIRGAW